MKSEFTRARNSKDAQWVSESLRRGTPGCTSEFIPAEFDAYVAVLHPISHCICSEENLAGFQSGNVSDSNHPMYREVRWREIEDINVPVIYGVTNADLNGLLMNCPLQHRRLDNGSWIVDTLLHGSGNIEPVLQPGDEWTYGPYEGSLDPKEARLIVNCLSSHTPESELCWFGIWEGFGFLDKTARKAPSIATRDRRWHLFRAPLGGLTESFDPHFGHQSANLAWSADRSWFVATEIDAEVTYVAGPQELVDSIHSTPGLETRIVSPDEPSIWFSDVLTPIIEKPENVVIPPGFENRAIDFPRNFEHEDRIRQLIDAVGRPGLRGFWKRLMMRLGTRRRRSSSVLVYKQLDEKDK